MVEATAVELVALDTNLATWSVKQMQKSDGPLGKMGDSYIKTIFFLWPSFVGKYSSTMGCIWIAYGL